MMQHPPPEDGSRIDAEEHAARLERYRQRINLALDRHTEWRIAKMWDEEWKRRKEAGR